jgi:ABC-type branched-subunit amino acid transport system permease subunit
VDRWIRFFTHFLVPIVFVCSFPWFFPFENAIQLGQVFAISYIIIVGLNMLVGLTNHFSLGHGGFVAIGAYGATLLSQKAGLSFIMGILLGAFLAGIMAALFSFISGKNKGLLFSIGTLVFGIAVSVLATKWVSLTGGTAGYSVNTPQVLGIEMDSSSYFWFVGILAVSISYFTGNILKGRFGRTLIAMGTNEKGTKMVKVDPRWWKTFSFFFSGFLAGLGGSLFAFQEGFIQSNQFDMNLSLLLLFGVLMGGAGSKWGPLFGTGALVLITQLIPYDGPFNMVITAGLLLLCVFMLPHGLVGFLSNIQFVKNLKRVRGGILHHPSAPLVELPVSQNRSLCIYEEPPLFKELTVIEHVQMGFHSQYRTGFFSNMLDLQRVEKEEQVFLGRAYDILRLIGIEKQAFNKIQTLGKEEQKLVKIAMALTFTPKEILQGKSYTGANGRELVLLIDPNLKKVIDVTGIEYGIENRQVN